MNTINQTYKNGIWTIYLEGRIDSTNAPEVEQQLIDFEDVKKVVIDVSALQYLSSAGLRILLRLCKKHLDMEVINASPEVYDIFDMTGFTEMMKIQKAFRQLSVEGCPVLGKGSNGIVYRTDPETIVKVYYNKEALPEIQHEREVARKAFILGIPTAIAYDVVQVGDQYGSVFESLNADVLSSMIAKNPEQFDEYIRIYTDMLKSIHQIEAKPGEFPSLKETALNWAYFLKDHLPSDTHQKLITLIQSVPEDRHLIHGDYHTNNLMRHNGEMLLIDMDTLSQGNPIFEFGTMFLAYKGFYELDSSLCPDFLGYTADIALRIWHAALRAYFKTENEAFLQNMEDKSKIIGYTRLMRRTIRRVGYDNPAGKAQIDLCKEQLIALCDRIDSLI